MTGNLDPLYQLKQDRLRRIQERFLTGAIDEGAFRVLMQNEGYIHRSHLDQEVRLAMGGANVGDDPAG